MFEQKHTYIPTKPGDPLDFDQYQGQETLKRRLLLRLNAMKKGESFRALLAAPAGQGKTSLARIIARELMKRGFAENYFEVIGGKFDTKLAADNFMRKLPKGSIVFIDEVHGLTGPARDAMYPAIQDNVYGFSEKKTMTPLPPDIHWLAATTDLGKVHPALQRRLVPIHLEPLTDRDLAWVALLQPRKVEIPAAWEMAKRCWSPWEIKDELYVTAGDISTERKDSIIELKHVLEACELLGIDANGLRPKDRAVLRCLFNSPKIVRGEMIYALARGPLVVMSQIDDQTFSSAIEPKLLRLGYVTVRSVGRALTEKAVDEYFSESEGVVDTESKAPNPQVG